MAQFHSRALCKEPDPQPAVVAQAFSPSAYAAGAEDRMSSGAQAKLENSSKTTHLKTHTITADKDGKTRKIWETATVKSGLKSYDN